MQHLIAWYKKWLLLLYPLNCCTMYNGRMHMDLSLGAPHSTEWWLQHTCRI